MKNSLLLASLAALAGCFTVTQAEYPAVECSRAADGSPSVAISGFETTYTRYTPVQSYATVWTAAPGHYGRHGHYHPGYAYPETVETTTYVPQTGVTAEYAEKAQDLFESAGFVVAATNAAYVVDVKFSRPVYDDGDLAAAAATSILSLFTADYICRRWDARMKIVEAATGKVLMLQNYSQEYYASVWSPFPVFGPASATATELSYAKNWALSALTDRTVADATAFLAKLRSK